MYANKEGFLIPLWGALCVIGALTATIFAVGFWVASVEVKVSAMGLELQKVNASENRLTRIETILEIQFPNAAKTATEKLSR